MSIEAVMAELTAALKEQTATLRELMASAPSDAPANPTQTTGAARTEPAARQGRKPRQATAPAAASPSGSSTANSAAAAAIDYPKLREAVLAVAKGKGHSVAVGILGKFGVKIAQELKPEQYQAVFDAMNEALIA